MDTKNFEPSKANFLVFISYALGKYFVAFLNSFGSLHMVATLSFKGADVGPHEHQKFPDKRF